MTLSLLSLKIWRSIKKGIKSAISEGIDVSLLSSLDLLRNCKTGATIPF